jgi:hypothetical protein
MSAQQPEALDRDRPIDVVAGFISAAAILAGALALVERPVRIGVFGVIAALVAAGMGGRHARLATIAVVLSTTCWVVGMVIAVLTHNPLW